MRQDKHRREKETPNKGGKTQSQALGKHTDPSLLVAEAEKEMWGPQSQPDSV